MMQRNVVQSVQDEAMRLVRNIDLIARPSWYHRPLDADELAAHPDRERIVATIVAVVNAACALTERNLREDRHAP